MSDRIDSNDPENYRPVEHPNPSDVDDAATRRVDEFNAAQAADRQAEDDWIHHRPYQGTRHGNTRRPLGGENRPSRLDRRGWDNARDDPEGENTFVPPEEMPPRGTVRFGRFPRKTPLIDLTPAVERRTGGSMASISEGRAAAQGAQQFANSSIGGALQLLKREIEDSIVQYLAAWGSGLNSAHLASILGMFAGMQERADEMLRMLAATGEITEEYIAYLEQ